MPELPEVETVCRGLALALEGRRLSRVVARRPDLRLPLPVDLSARLEGRIVAAIRRRAKYMLWEMDDGTVLIGHLGMSGRMHVGEGAMPDPKPHDHVTFETVEGPWVIFNDHRRFGLMVLDHRDTLDGHPLLAGIGPEPLGNRFDGPTLSRALAGRRTPIKAALLDQKVVAGLGNIYVSEALFRARISPLREAATVAGARAARLVPAIRDVLNEAIAAGGSTLRDYVRADGELGYFQHSFKVYDREGAPCPACDRSVILRIVQSNRSTYYCPRCQK
ncbi:bifunctional DNA-formamidopyrimidine glycosylase/DNA-(apurinic or apyrimidinic site) lyase [Zavarzinia compransoris]|uniref:bifunctional DNA-formamidopyrimidine glycosylase/DNA-(apurinic or apyrimidinic site) lyase n=1 Tax=Zavarzinia marina TaxID=2911065 RepID=UPI001F2B9D4E|nr:bifunctional DNA-formamidopyrimidine glycosylase/DNA-(apurinic or apyrimidinic site) lyase [Zavarzinia marina]MCF4167447.1 bifunctional DNA-formamidopyrimidine glycosylase/DNA-(apurinic or apyrimidinic site) lyase [Zavarzinia marina]